MRKHSSNVGLIMGASALAAFCLVSAGSYGVTVSKTETFNSAASTAADGWSSVVGPSTDGTDTGMGWQNSNFAGGTAGEGGATGSNYLYQGSGTTQRGTLPPVSGPQYFADTTLTGGTPLHAVGLVWTATGSLYLGAPQTTTSSFPTTAWNDHNSTAFQGTGGAGSAQGAIPGIQIGFCTTNATANQFGSSSPTLFPTFIGFQLYRSNASANGQKGSQYVQLTAFDTTGGGGALGNTSASGRGSTFDPVTQTWSGATEMSTEIGGAGVSYAKNINSDTADGGPAPTTVVSDGKYTYNFKFDGINDVESLQMYDSSGNPVFTDVVGNPAPLTNAVASSKFGTTWNPYIDSFGISLNGFGATGLADRQQVALDNTTYGYTSSVPEPTAIGLVIAGSSLLMRRRRK